MLELIWLDLLYASFVSGEGEDDTRKKKYLIEWEILA